MVVREWVDQEEILQHPVVQGFTSHSVEVSILAWPMMAKQYLNAKMVIEKIKVGLMVNTVDKSAKGFATAYRLKNTVVELMEGEEEKVLRAKVKEVAAAARKVVADGGSSWHDVNEDISKTHRERKINRSKIIYSKR